jgi:hypothetical protein
MKRTHPKFSTATLLAAGTMLVSGPALAGSAEGARVHDTDTHQTQPDDRATSHTDRGDNLRVENDAQPPISDRAGQYLREDQPEVVRTDRQDTARQDTDRRELDARNADARTNTQPRESKQRAAAWTSEDQQKCDMYVDKDVQKFDGRVVSATSFLTNGDTHTQESPKLFVSEDGEAYLLIDTQSQDQYLSQKDVMERDEFSTAYGDDRQKEHRGMDHHNVQLSELEGETQVKLKGRVIERDGFNAILVKSIERKTDSAMLEEDSQAAELQSTRR